MSFHTPRGPNSHSPRRMLGHARHMKRFQFDRSQKDGFELLDVQGTCTAHARHMHGTCTAHDAGICGETRWMQKTYSIFRPGGSPTFPGGG
eukprot:gene22213-biopygen4207